MGKHITRSLCFLLPLCWRRCCLGCCSGPRTKPLPAECWKRTPLAVSSQPKNSLDVLFLGDSEAYSGFVPMALWKDTGIASFVCASVDQKPYETEDFLREALKNQSPKVVVLEANVLYRAYSTQDLLVPKLQALFPRAAVSQQLEDVLRSGALLHSGLYGGVPRPGLSPADPGRPSGRSDRLYGPHRGPGRPDKAESPLSGDHGRPLQRKRGRAWCFSAFPARKTGAWPGTTP